MSTEPIDYPCSSQKEFDVCADLASSLVEMLAPGAPLVYKDIGVSANGMGEPCRIYYTEQKTVGAIVFPTADRLKDIQSAADQLEQLIIVNPQWNLSKGQVVSDFGIGPWKKKAEDFLATFEPTFSLTEQRIGNPGSIDAATGERYVSGGVVRILRSYPGAFDIFVVIADGSSAHLRSLDKMPGYKELDAMIVEGRKQKMDIFQKGQAIWRGNTPNQGVAVTVVDEDDTYQDGVIRAEDIKLMDKSTLRRLLLANGLPTSGTIERLRQRALDALEKSA